MQTVALTLALIRQRVGPDYDALAAANVPPGSAVIRPAGRAWLNVMPGASTVLDMAAQPFVAFHNYTLQTAIADIHNDIYIRVLALPLSVPGVGKVWIYYTSGLDGVDAPVMDTTGRVHVVRGPPDPSILAEYKEIKRGYQLS